MFSCNWTFEQTAVSLHLQSSFFAGTVVYCTTHLACGMLELATQRHSLCLTVKLTQRNTVYVFLTLAIYFRQHRRELQCKPRLLISVYVLTG